ncbi:hypothetical protein PoB_003725600 [Plakobranchus ocellatus]|uniref:Peptidase A2 domain-containing protein n=1 Tax=Plakobranchus ocellatus TaxID=259542 RepID=A0AAV4AHU8_9GAST|nr:hypothetical protein PoB_003725600 [Plakobranchus ocellatus]
MKVDTGAETSTIPAKLWEKIMRKPRLRESRMILKAFGNTKIENEGTATVPISVGEKQIRTEIFVTKGQTTPILGLQACMKLNLIQKGKNGQHIQANAIDLVKKEKNNKWPNPLTKQELQEQFPDLFEGVGSCNAQYHIHLKEEAVPVIQPPRRVPPAIMPELKKKLKKMEENGITEVVDEPTEWVHNLVIAQKPDGSLRLCPRDFKRLLTNRAQQQPTEITNFVVMTTLDDILRHSFRKRSLEGKLEIKRQGPEPPQGTLSLDPAGGLPSPKTPCQCSHPRAAVGNG